MNLEEIFNKAANGVLNYEQFQEAIAKEGIKLADLSSGEYVSKNKYNDDLLSKSNEINTLNSSIQQRETDLADLRNKLAAAGTDSAKLAELTTNFDNLNSKYQQEKLDWQKQLENERYEFMVKEYANTKSFTSAAAKRDFTNEMIRKKLQVENGRILGADDFTSSYQQENADAFLTEQKKEETPKPQFAGKTSGMGEVKKEQSPFSFHFQTVRPMPKDE